METGVALVRQRGEKQAQPRDHTHTHTHALIAEHMKVYDVMNAGAAALSRLMTSRQSKPITERQQTSFVTSQELGWHCIDHTSTYGQGTCFVITYVGQEDSTCFRHDEASI